MRFLEPNLLTMMTRGYFQVTSPAKLVSRNLMSRSTRKPNRPRNLRKIRRKLTAKNFRKSMNRMQNISVNLKKRKMPKSRKLSSFVSTIKTVKTSRMWRISRRSNSCRGQPKMAAVKFRLLPSKLFLMKPKDNLTKMFKTRSTQSTKKSITH